MSNNNSGTSGRTEMSGVNYPPSVSGSQSVSLRTDGLLVAHPLSYTANPGASPKLIIEAPLADHQLQMLVTILQPRTPLGIVVKVGPRTAIRIEGADDTQPTLEALVIITTALHAHLTDYIRSITFLEGVLGLPPTLIQIL